MGQIVQEGRWKGGFIAYGYKTEKCGSLNKRNHEVHELRINDDEALVVQKIFHKYVNEGYGAHRICNCLEESGIRTRNNTKFFKTTIYGMLKNVLYTGILCSGETVSEVFLNLQIIDVDTFERAQVLLKQRSKECMDRRTALNTKGQPLLSGDMFCGHRGARMTLTTSKTKYIKKDGEVSIYPRVRYSCYNKAKETVPCTGSKKYTSYKLDALVEKVLHQIFEQIKEQPRVTLLEQQHDRIMSEKNANCYGGNSKNPIRII